MYSTNFQSLNKEENDINSQKIILSKKSISMMPFKTNLSNNFTYDFPRIVLIGKISDIRKEILDLLFGIGNINLNSDRPVHIFFKKSSENDTYVKVGNLGGKIYKFKNMHRRIEEERILKTTEILNLKIYSSDIIREFELIIIPSKYSDNYILNDSDVNVMINNYNNEKFFELILEEHIVKAKIIYIEKDSSQEKEYETYEFYEKFILPYAVSQNKSWVHKIFEGNTERNILYSDNDFVLVPDILWTDQSNIKELHCISIFKNPNLMSIRDLNSSSIELLNKIVKISKKTLKENYNINEDNIDIYFHYHPSIWQLHLHFVNRLVKDNHKKYYFSEIVNNLLSDSDYYKKNELEL